MGMSVNSESHLVRSIRYLRSINVQNATRWRHLIIIPGRYQTGCQQTEGT